MKVAIIGTGYVGLPTGLGLADLNHQVVCIDREISKIQRLQQGIVTLYEDGLEELLKKHTETGNISFTTSMQEGVKDADLVVIAVGTPPHPVTNEADLQYIYAAAAEFAPFLDKYTVVANKSTVPVGTGDTIENLIKKTNKNADFDVVSLPEFLREGYAVYDFFHPDRIIVGANTERAKQTIEKLYAPLLERSPNTKMLCVERRSSETIKYASNSFLAAKIHFINEMANFCEKVGANIYEVANGMGLDSRIGPSFLNPGPGFGGSCFPKDTLAINFMANQNCVDLSIIRATIEGNNKRLHDMADRIINAIPRDENEPVIGVLGLAFKNGTDDCRVSPAMQILDIILEAKPKLKLKVYDPKAMDNAKELLKATLNRITFCNSALEATEGCDVLALLTEWPEFRDLDLHVVFNSMRNKAIVDCRNMLSKKQAQELGFSYQGVGI